MDHLLAVRDLRVSFRLPEGVVEAVKGVSFTIDPGASVALVGESGSGKSVISQAIMGLLPKAGTIDTGEILLRDPASGQITDIAALDRNSVQMREIRGGRISIIFPEPNTSLSALHTIGDQISEALSLHRAVTRSEALELTAEMLRLAGFPDPQRALRTYPFELSGGLRQRAMIAMALVCHPALLIADEPTTALDVTIQAQILKQIRDLQQELHMALLLITHDLGVVANMAEEVVVIYHGEVMEYGTLDHIFREPSHPYLKALLRAVPRFDMARDERLVPIREIKPNTDNLHTPQHPLPADYDRHRPILSVRNVRKQFRIRATGGGHETRVQAVDDVSFDIMRGECLGLVGESGCGKTTLSKILMQALKPDQGQVSFYDGYRDIDLLALDGRELTDFRQRMQFVFQDPFSSLNPRMTIYDILTEPLVIHKVGTRRQRQTIARELMELVGLDVRYLQRYPHSFSGGQRQRIGIARALALSPELIICDEPVSALDVSVQAQILNLLKDLQKQLGLTYLFISHNLAVVDYIADRIAVMCRGQLVELAPKELLFRRPLHPYTQALLSAVPDPNPDHLLDFERLMLDRASDPLAWPAPFTHHPDAPASLIEVEDGHYVRAAAGTRREELVA
ncbi:ABC transporter ATP-binding protein [Marinobacterium nitratireducens]|uniref:ABC transporter ATP-binding protein n=1 Tax=Marinobacterium nitratireducens TaxID=518897 RepID=A0A918DNL3_9GAMM|nr:ABC transporter ATP-binding protein [Marinobacterium nitratireducens]GGO77090.1 ABC transporter ATP-binding protein [Marinobacterium nitratireducens]